MKEIIISVALACNMASACMHSSKLSDQCELAKAFWLATRGGDVPYTQEEINVFKCGLCPGVTETSVGTANQKTGADGNLQ